MRTAMILDDDVFQAAKAQAEVPTFKVETGAEIIPTSRAKEMLADDPL